MSEWKECKLGDELELLYGKALKESERKEGDFPVYGSNGIVGYHNEYLVKTPGIIIGRKGSVGEIKFTNMDFFPIDTTYYVSLKNDNDIKFFYYFLLTLQLNEMNSHSAVPGLNRNDVYAIDVTLPPLPEQKAIAGVLSSLDDKIDLLHRQNKTLEAMAETLFRQWFVEEAEEEWEEGKLGDVADFNNGKSRPESIEGSTIPIYGGNGILGYTIRSNSEGMSIVIGRVGAYCGSLYIENRPIWITDNALSAKLKDKKYTSYLYYLLKSLNLNQMAEGSSHPLLTQTLLNTIDITIPSNDIIAAFCGFADSILMKSFFNKHQIRTIKKLRDILLPKLMSGEVRVSL